MYFKVLIIVVLMTLAGCEQSNDRAEGLDATRVADAMAESDPRYLRAYEPRAFQFPFDHGPHAGFKTEWWYLTGNLHDENKRRFGYQFTLFRIALSPTPQERTSEWAADDIYMAHFALTDVQNQRFYHFERFSRGAAGLAGAQASPFRVWLEDWQLYSTRENFFPLRLKINHDELAMDLSLSSDKPMVLQGDRGLSQKSADPGNASYYYSYTRMPTQGQITIEGKSFDVHGNSWLDREWSTSALGVDQQGWDWFALQLNDGRELMFYQLRQHDGSADKFSKGVMVFEDGTSLLLTSDEVKLEPTAHWLSDESKVRYPIQWRLSLAKFDLDLTVKAVLPHQEMRLSVRYWEGAVDVQGSSEGQPIQGRGYLELAGYE